jgi:DNA-binding FrmR family transcriptional regulator
MRGQVGAIEPSLSTEADCADVLMLLWNVRGGGNCLMAEVLEDQVRFATVASRINNDAVTLM